jgi:DNA-binding LacI/PurR family transcriptional regulator/signal transduction histidine kinase
MGYCMKTNINIDSAKKHGRHILQKERPTIAYIAGSLGGIGLPMWSGIRDMTQKRDVNLICFPGSNLNNPDGFEAQANIIFSLVSAETVDGVLSWSSLFGQYVSSEELAAFHDRFHPLPVVTMGSTFKQFPSMLLDSYEGMCEAVAHLIEVHGCRHLAFIRGPEMHVYAQGRYRAYVETIEAHGLQVDQRLVTPPARWGPATGREAIRILLDERSLRPKVDIDAIVSVSEDTLFGALEVLQERGIRIPNDLAIVGFDDTILSQTNTPPITTVAAPFYELGYQSTGTLLDLMQGIKVPKVTIVPSRLVVRQSCGCVDQDVAQAVVNAVKIDNQTIETIPVTKREDIVSAMIQAVGSSACNVESDWVNHLFNSFVEELNGKSSGAFVTALDGILRQVAEAGKGVSAQQSSMAAGEAVSVWHGVLSSLRREAWPYLSEIELETAENIWQQARVMIGKITQRIQAHQQKVTEYQFNIIRQIGAAMLTTLDIDGLVSVLASGLPRVSISSCYLALYENQQPYRYPQQAPEWSRLVMAYNKKGRIKLEPSGRLFRSLQLVPEGMLPQMHQYCFAVYALHFRDQQFGFIIFEIGAHQKAAYELYETLSIQIGSALHGVLLMQRVQDKTIKLDQAYQRLKENQQKMIIIEKMASLGRLTAGIAHEMNTPLATVRASMKELKSLVDEYKKSINSSQVLPEDHQAIAEEMIKYIDLATKAAEKSAGFIRGIKGQTKNLNSPFNEIFNASEVIFDVLSLLEFKINKTSCRLISDLDESIMLNGNKQGLSQIVTNLVNNAIEASSKSQGIITVKLIQSKQKEAELIVEDTGEGISKENISKIFDPLFTTKPFGEATGLGLSIVQEFVNQFNGSISVTSKPGLTKFTVIIPL